MAVTDVTSLSELLSALRTATPAVVYIQAGKGFSDPGCLSEVIRQLAAENSPAWFFRVSPMSLWGYSCHLFFGMIPMIIRGALD